MSNSSTATAKKECLTDEARQIMQSHAPWINNNPVLISLLYDLNLLPKVVLTFDDMKLYEKMMLIVCHVKDLSEKNDKQLADALRRVMKAEDDNGRLQDNEFRREQWLANAKTEAGYHRNISFDTIWKEVLDKSRKFDALMGTKK